MRLLMVTSRNIDKNGGESALIMGRHIALYQKYGIKTDIVFFHKNTEKSYSNIYPGITFIPCNTSSIYNKIGELMETGEYQGIVSSGFYDKSFTDFIYKERKVVNFLYIVDIHATIKEMYEYCIPDLYHILGTRYLYIMKKIRFVETLKAADYAFVVSDEEIVEVNKFIPRNNIKFLKVRCGCYETVNINAYFVERKKQRELLKMDDNTLSFVYSGSKDRWQKYEETKRIFKRIQNMGIKCKFAFYMNLDDLSKQEIYDYLGRNNVLIRWVTPEQMKSELMAFDVGMLLRDNKWTNRVAFPNKYSDYIGGGLHLCISEAIVEPYKIAKDYNLRLLDMENLEKSVKEIRYDRRTQLQEYILLCKKIVDNELIYGTQVEEQCKVFVKHIMTI